MTYAGESTADSLCSLKLRRGFEPQVQALESVALSDTKLQDAGNPNSCCELVLRVVDVVG